MSADERATHVYEPPAPRARSRPSPRGCSASCGCCRCSTRCGRRSIRPRTRRASSSPRRWTLDNFVAAWHAAPFARYFANTMHAGDDGARRAARARHARRRTRSRASSSRAATSRSGSCCVQLMIMPDVLIVENYRTMTALGLRDTILAIGAAVHGERVRHLPAAPDVQDGPARARRGGARRGLLAAADAVARVRAARAPDLPRVRAGLGVVPLEQLPVAADHHQLGRDAAGDGRACRCSRRPTRASTGRSSPPRRCCRPGRC